MSDVLKVTSDIKQVKFYLIGILGIVGGGLFSCFLYSLAFKGPYLNLIAFIFATIVLLFVFFVVYSILKLVVIDVYDDKLIIKPIFGFTNTIIYRDEIISWIEIEKKDKNDVWYVLSIFTDNYKFRLSSATFKNYTKLKSAITRGKFHDVEKERKTQSTITKIWSFILFIIAAILLSVAYDSFQKKDIILKYTDLTTIREVVISEIKIIKGSKGARSIELILEDYPEFRFKIAGDAYHATYTDFFVNSVYTGDTLLVDIKTDVYKKKLTMEQEMSFFDKTVNYNQINVYGLRNKENRYLTLENYNQHKSRNKYLFFLIFGLVVLGFSLFLYIKSIKQASFNTSR